MTLDFAASTDNLKVTGYDLLRDGAKVWTLTDGTTSLTYGGLTCGTSYTLGANAFDAAGNHSATAFTSAKTLACPATTTTTTTTPTTTTSSPGTVLYGKNWEDGLIDSGGWWHQAADQFSTNPFNGIMYGTISIGSNADNGGKAANFFLPSYTGGHQGVEMLHDRTVKNGADEWFAIALYFPSDFAASMTNTNGTTMVSGPTCPNYYSVNGCMENLGVSNNSMYVLINSGACPASGVAPGCPYYSGSPNFPGICRGFTSCTPRYVLPPGNLTANVWHEVILHIYYTLDNAGVVQAWHRLKGQSGWTKAVDMAGGFPTLQAGPTTFGQTVTASNINGWPSTDQFGGYRSPATATSTWSVDNWCRATSFDAAASCFG